jgi:hypothetical protein
LVVLGAVCNTATMVALRRPRAQEIAQRFHDDVQIAHVMGRPEILNPLKPKDRTLNQRDRP